MAMTMKLMMIMITGIGHVRYNKELRHHQTRSFTRKPRNPVRIYMCFPNLIFNRDKYVLGRVFITANLPAFVVAFVDS